MAEARRPRTAAIEKKRNCIVAMKVVFEMEEFLLLAFGAVDTGSTKTLARPLLLI